jgi:pimeloyl-ACP methyl ester carboxylesterase
VQSITSRDGTSIGYTTVGEGPPLILVDGAFGSRAFGPNESLVALLADRFTVVTYDRRGRGASNDLTGHGPGGVLREVDDLAALVDAVGGSAHLYGISSGAALALEAATRGVPVTKLALFEAPFIIDDSRPPVPDDYPARMKELLAADRRGKAVATFMSQGIGLNPAIVALMRLMPAWSAMKGVAHTLPYDVDVTFDLQHGHPLPAARWSELECPVMVVDGGKSPTWMRRAMTELASSLPKATSVTLPGQTHLVKAAVLAPELLGFFTAPTAAPPTGCPSSYDSQEEQQ